MKRWDIKDLTLGGLFTALIAVGAFLKITIPVQPVPMHFTLQFFFVLLQYAHQRLNHTFFLPQI